MKITFLVVLSVMLLQGCTTYNGEVLRMEDAHSAAIDAALSSEVQP